MGNIYLYSIGLDGLVCMYSAKDNFDLNIKIDLGEGLGGGLIHEVSAEKK